MRLNTIPPAASPRIPPPSPPLASTTRRARAQSRVRSHHHALRHHQGALNMNHGEIKRFHDLVSSIDVNHDDHVSRKEFVDTLDLKQ